MDSNAWAGSNIIPNDPNPQNMNGKMLEAFLNRNPGMIVVNSLPICSGLITRRRKTTKGQEEAALDIFIVCQKMLPLINAMIIDEKRQHQLTNFKRIQNRPKSTESDHCYVELTLSLNFFNFT